MPISTENNHALLLCQSAWSNCQLSIYILYLTDAKLTSTTNSPVGMRFVVDTGKTVTVHVEGSRSDMARVQGPAFFGSSIVGLLVVYAHWDPFFDRVG